MTTSDIIKQLCKSEKISMSELARRIGQSRQNLYKKLQRETLTAAEFQQIADAVGVEYSQMFLLPDGTHLKIEP